MAKLQSLDPHTPMFAQFREKTGPIVLASTFFVPKERTESFLVLFRRQAEFMEVQPGFVSLQTHEGRPQGHLLPRPRRSSHGNPRPGRRRVLRPMAAKRTMASRTGLQSVRGQIFTAARGRRATWWKWAPLSCLVAIPPTA